MTITLSFATLTYFSPQGWTFHRYIWAKSALAMVISLRWVYSCKVSSRRLSPFGDGSPRRSRRRFRQLFLYWRWGLCLCWLNLAVSVSRRLASLEPLSRRRLYSNFLIFFWVIRSTSLLHCSRLPIAICCAVLSAESTFVSARSRRPTFKSEVGYASIK